MLIVVASVLIHLVGGLLTLLILRLLLLLLLLLLLVVIAILSLTLLYWCWTGILRLQRVKAGTKLRALR